MEKISIVRRRLEVSPTRAELRARQRMEDHPPESMSGGAAVMALTGKTETPDDGNRPLSVDLGPQVMDELWSGGHLDETSSGQRHFIVEAQKTSQEGRTVLSLQFMKPDYYLRLLTTEEVCEMLHISRSTLYAFVHEKKLKTYRMGRSLRYRFQDVLNFLTGCEADRD
jgi:excisionase family DNA binding protein